jgi:predicted nucleotidyltransferase
MNSPVFPTQLHEETANQVWDYFSAIPEIDTVLAVNSCARGRATPESDLDFAILAKPGIAADEIIMMESAWREYMCQNPVYQRYSKSGAFAVLHLDIITGSYSPMALDDAGGPDYFEVEIGNQVAYSAPMGLPGPFFMQLREKWLPYYADEVQLERLRMHRNACQHDLDHIPVFVRRGLYFQAFDRLYKAFQEFLQTLFIAYRTYPIAYNKWIKEQVEVLLGMPELYRELPGILSIENLESDALTLHGAKLNDLLKEYCKV